MLSRRSVMAAAACAALWWANWAMLAGSNGWAGIVVDGCIRDSEEINVCQIGVRALATRIRAKNNKTGAGQRDVRVQIGDVNRLPGDWIYADADAASWWRDTNSIEPPSIGERVFPDVALNIFLQSSLIFITAEI